MYPALSQDAQDPARFPQVAPLHAAHGKDREVFRTADENLFGEVRRWESGVERFDGHFLVVRVEHRPQAEEGGVELGSCPLDQRKEGGTPGDHLKAPPEGPPAPPVPLSPTQEVTRLTVNPKERGPS